MVRCQQTDGQTEREKERKREGEKSERDWAGRVVAKSTGFVAIYSVARD